MKPGKLYTLALWRIFLGARRSSDGSYTENGKIIRCQFSVSTRDDQKAYRFVFFGWAFWFAVIPARS